MKPPVPDFDRLSDRLRRARKRGLVLRTLSILLACVALLALLVARVVLADSGHLQWPALITASLAVALLVLVYVLREDRR
jgi:peptidoglycan/LPS O-acetylase OafA/YrhL